MADDRADQPDTIEESDSPSARQLLHAATGDRDAEAKALADRSEGAVSEDDAKAAVKGAHGDVHDEDAPEHDVATPDDAKSARDEKVRTER
jgi:hypothetical protein